MRETVGSADNVDGHQQLLRLLLATVAAHTISKASQKTPAKEPQVSWSKHMCL